MTASHVRIFGTALVGLWTLTAAAAQAQLGGHGMPSPPRPLHVRLAEADVIALGAVERVATGRFSIADAEAWRGSPGRRFEIKRAPSEAPDLVPGSRVLLVLAGARSPFVFVDEPREVTVLSDEADLDAWGAALARLATARGDPEALGQTYLAWIDGTDDGLRDLGVRGLGDREGGRVQMPEGEPLRRADAALDPTRPSEIRLASAGIAAADPASLARLLASAGRPDLDVGVARVALAAGVLTRHPDATPAVATALGHPNREIRIASIPAATRLAEEPVVRAALEELAAEETDPEVRSAIAGALGHAKPARRERR